MSGVLQIFQVLENQIFMDSVGFLSGAVVNIQHMSDLEIQHENELSGMLGSFALALAKARTRGQSYLFGRPHRTILVLGSENDADKEMQLFKTDDKLFQRLKDNRTKTDLLMQYYQRSPFQTLAVQHLACGAKECGWKAEKPFLDHMDQRTRCIMSTKVVEDINNQQKNARQQTQWGGRYRRPQNGLTASILGKVTSQIHGFKPLDLGADNGHATEVLDKADLCPLTTGSLPFTEVGGQQKAPYFSPAAEGVAIPTADLHVIRALGPTDQLRDVAKTWSGFISDSQHSIAFQLGPDNAKLCEVKPDQWFVGVTHFKDSAALVWPVEFVSDPGTPFKYVNWSQINEPFFLTVLGLEGVKGVNLSLKSWAWQLQQGVDTKVVAPALRWTIDGDVSDVLELAARAAFWNLPRYTLENIAQSRGVL